MKVLVIDNDSEARASLRDLLREVESEGTDDGQSSVRRAAPSKQRRTQRARQEFEPEPESDFYSDEDEGFEQDDDHNPHTIVGSEHMSIFAQSTDAQFSAVEDAVLQTPRGRWFLAEYLRRHRAADTDRVLSAIETLQTRVGGVQDNPVMTALRRELQEIAVTIVHTRREIASLKGDPGTNGFTHATDELDTLVAASERATGDILSSVERLQDVGLRLRDKGTEATECEAIEAQAITILRACAAQDFTGQRVSRIVNAFRAIEQRIAVALDAIAAGETHHRSSHDQGLPSHLRGHSPLSGQTSHHQTQAPVQGHHPSHQTHTGHQTHQSHQPSQSRDTTWVTPAADRIIRGENSSDTQFEYSVARAY